MKISDFNSIPGAPDIPTSITEGEGAMDSYIASLIMHAAKVERETDSDSNVYRWNINEEAEFRGAVNTAAKNVMTALANAV